MVKLAIPPLSCCLFNNYLNYSVIFLYVRARVGQLIFICLGGKHGLPRNKAETCPHKAYDGYVMQARLDFNRRLHTMTTLCITTTYIYCSKKGQETVVSQQVHL